MKLNENTKIIGDKVILVPYEPKHVEKYHNWMKSLELQELTASEPLTLEKEYEMQRSWREDVDKLTFLIVSRRLYDETQDEIESLVGDTNLFLRKEESDNEEHSTDIQVAEAEIMIAEPKSRKQGLGWEAMLILMKYAQAELGIHKFEVKIGVDNTKSIKMFTKMKFSEISRSDVFHEVTMERKVTVDWISWIEKEIKFKIENYQ